MLKLVKVVIVTNALLSSIAFADTTSTTMDVSATVAASCSISAAPLAFGSYTLNQLDSKTSVSLTCTNGTSYTIEMDKGSGKGASFEVRKLTSNGNTLDYSIYTDSNYKEVWGDGTGGSGVVKDTGSGVEQTINVFGRIPPNQSSPVSDTPYTDVINVTVSF